MNQEAKKWSNRGHHHSLTIHQRFWEKVDTSSGECWEWLGSRNESGYGRFRIGTKTVRASRASILLSGGEIPDSMLALHRCDNPACVRPSHLYVGTHRDNTRDMVKRGRARVPHGESSPLSKLTERDVRFIRKSYAAGMGTCRQIAERFGVCDSHVSAIINRKRWAHV